MDSGFTTSQKTQAAKCAWLLYYNRYLHDHGKINAEARNKMVAVIHAHYGPTNGNKIRAIS